MAGSLSELEELVRSELTRPAPPSAILLARAIRERHGANLRATVFYGSCLRRATDEGVLDFYVLVDGYRAAYRSRALALANALLPPNVFYLETPGPEGVRRCKYAVLSARDVERAAAGAWLRPGVWARFAQPVLAADWRDDSSLDWLSAQVARCILTFARTLLPVVRRAGAGAPAAAEFWPRAFQETYASETRPEALASIRALYDASPARYQRALELALRALDEEARREAPAGRTVGSGTPGESGLRWGLRRPLAKAVYAAGLFKTAFTFGDWLPYALWKLQRHSGRAIVASERQRRHPLLYGWPLLLRVLRDRALR